MSTVHTTDLDEEVMSLSEASTEASTSSGLDELSAISPTEYICLISDDERIDLEAEVHQMVDDYIRDHVLCFADPDFHVILDDEICTHWFNQSMDANLCNIADYDIVSDHIRLYIQNYFDCGYGIPVRSRRNTVSGDNSVMREQFAHKIRLLQDINADLPAQRTAEWYTFRNSLITASDMGKLFMSEAKYNDVIYKKCLSQGTGQGFNQGQVVGQVQPPTKPKQVNTESSLHKGQKYEPLSRMIYEVMFGTRVSSEFGCIRHPTIPCIGASPDGINIDPTSERFGRMVEIKNIVNREITGIPSKEYWIQTQIQMETCDLDECDFLETRFLQYPGEEEFWTDAETRDYKGVILYFVERVSLGEAQKTDGEPRYEYMPLDIELTEEAVHAWIAGVRDQLRGQWTLYETQWWYLADYSCVLIERNRAWFEAARPRIEEAWAVIERERVSGFEHRAPKKQVKAKDKDSGRTGLVVMKEGAEVENTVCE